MTNSKVLLLVGAAAVGLYLLTRSRPAAPQIAARSPVATPKGQGVTSVSWLGNVVGALIGATAYDPSAAGKDRSSPNANLTTLWNPVSASPAVLPYSYKQATVDLPSLLGSDDLFTPSAGSAGAYADDEDTGTGSGPLADAYA